MMMMNKKHIGVLNGLGILIWFLSAGGGHTVAHASPEDRIDVNVSASDNAASDNAASDNAASDSGNAEAIEERALNDDISDRGYRDRAAAAVLAALEERMTVWKRTNVDSGAVERIYVRSCRQGKTDCAKRLAAFAALFTDAGVQHQIDPMLLAAVGLRETGLNPFAEGGVGERGVVQLHPRGVGARVKFVKDRWYRSKCERQADACQADVVDVGARLLAAAISRCGSVSEGLGAYNSGVCQETAYSRLVLKERGKLIALLKVAAPTARAKAKSALSR